MKVNQSNKVIRNSFHIITLVLITVTNCQLVIRQDGTENSYSVAAPGSQISFSRFYGGQVGQLLNQPHQQYPVFHNQAPTNILSQGQVFQQGNQLKYPSAPAFQNPAQIFYTQDGQQLLEPQVQQSTPLVNNNLHALDILRQQYQQQELLFRQQDQKVRHHNTVSQQQTGTQYQSQESLQYNQGGQPSQQPTLANQQQQLLGTLFSPSNEVSQVKFSSSGLNYTF